MLDETRESIARLSRDLKEASATMGLAEARFLVTAYYQIQENRKRAENQVRALTEREEPNLTLDWLAEQSGVLERHRTEVQPEIAALGRGGT